MKTLLATLLAACLTLPSAAAFADKQTSVALYNAAKRKYELGEYEKAAALFAQAYDEHPAPAYLFNVGLSYDKLEDCPKALEYFTRYLDEKPDAKNRAEVESQIDALRVKCPEKTEVVETEPETTPKETEKPVETEVASNENSAAETEVDSGVKTTLVSPRPKWFTAAADLGIALFDIGDVVVPAAPSLRVSGALPLRYFGIAVEPNAAIELQTMPYEHGMDSDSTVLFTTLLVGASATYPAEAKLRFGGDLGFGVLRFSGLKMGNPFIADGASQSGAANAFAFRIGAAVEYDIMKGLAAAVTPAYVIAAGADDLREQISSISRIELMVGVRYRL